MGLGPIVLERGKEGRQRTKDTWSRHQGVLDLESNVQYGKGGAGTFSGGELRTQISDPWHLARKVLDKFVKAGAPEEIRFVSTPHIGTYRVVSMIEKCVPTIMALGGELRFPAAARGQATATHKWWKSTRASSLSGSAVVLHIGTRPPRHRQ
jgi:uncharacterized FAD-dependent dehydrogenase